MVAALLDTDLASAVPRDVIGLGLDLFPMPVAQVVRTRTGFTLAVTNRAFRRLRLGDVGEPSVIDTMGVEIGRLFAGDRLHVEFDWTYGEDLARRYYRVTVARATATVADACILTLVDQTARVNTERSLRREMTTDSLTGLPNREGFSEQGEAPSADRRPCAVLVVDLARFSRINACLGGLAGDELLITVARRIKGAVRVRDTLARIGGNEFGILVTDDADHSDAMMLGERVRRALSAPFRLAEYEIGVECAIGIAYGHTDEELEELLRQAQFATKRAKSSGLIETYEKQVFAIARAQFGMETALRHAVEDQRLRLAFQPICDLTTGRIKSFEALARWRARDGREISPVEFIPVAEESGLIVPLGRWAMDEAARTLAAWDMATGGNSGGRVAVNLSAIQLQRDAVPDMVRRALDAHRLDGDRLTLELTESALVCEPDRIARVMHALKDMGATLAMDDFGTGYSNLGYLQKLPIDILKIDRSFVTTMLADRDKVAIVRAVLGLAGALGMWTTAEGIETVELSQTLAALGCTYGQGYLYARPLEADAALAMLLAQV
ncbi:bifunctional diguanylate cyclase/phosphodiesterase [Sphingomonas sp. KR1UV-12]|uniref:Bifunctional diguanylate cyclase/phosphodiesterase n=1 Tax=Sphingomonas aurea TaxID=3063994 RepID=A0ABT9EIH4_9SPHN|nr:bifunctional diguanylate cyclase/phosphodiesterase [Sphingomonas sp. KR1UV-12]MDP1026762.1 bifunctional diguanylate cyclase/phosphodiesterase [Sphingomonas sp. KR1UV-12]